MRISTFSHQNRKLWVFYKPLHSRTKDVKTNLVGYKRNRENIKCIIPEKVSLYPIWAEIPQLHQDPQHCLPHSSNLSMVTSSNGYIENQPKWRNYTTKKKIYAEQKIFTKQRGAVEVSSTTRSNKVTHWDTSICKGQCSSIYASRSSSCMSNVKTKFIRSSITSPRENESNMPRRW